MRYGHFTADGTEFVITRPETPRPWVNYLVNDHYAAVLSQCADGYSVARADVAQPLLRWDSAQWRRDRPGRYLFIKENSRLKAQGSRQKSAGPEPRAYSLAPVWSATYQPLCVRPEAFQARHGLGYTIIRSTYAGVAADVTYFVPTADACEVWLVTLTNRTRRTRRLEVLPYVDWWRGDETADGSAEEEALLRHRVWLDRPLQAVFAQQTAVRQAGALQPVRGVAFLASGLSLDGCVTRKAAFLGRDNTAAHPAMLYETPFRSAPLCTGEAGVGVLRHVLSLAAGESVTFTVIVGHASTRNDVRGLIEKYRRVPEAQAELSRVQALWRQRVVGNLTVETPDHEVNQLLNVWAKYQIYVRHLCDRAPSMDRPAATARGYRDACQDAEALAVLQPQRVRQQLLCLAALIHRDGTSASGGSEAATPVRHPSHRDDPLWLTCAVAAYVRETGDGALLQERVPSCVDAPDRRDEASSTQDDTLLDHLAMSLQQVLHAVGPHGLPLIGDGDTQASFDAAGRQGRGESVWSAVALVRALKTLAEVAEWIGVSATAQVLRARADVMTQRVNEAAWDGQWYVAGFTDDGVPFGSRQSTAGRIDLATQAWALLAGVPDEHRQQELLQAIDRHLRRACGYVACAPPYTVGEPSLGRISFCAAGMEANGSVIVQAAAEMLRADCQAGRGNQAYRMLRALLPNAQPDPQRYQAEPYVLAQYLIGPAHPYRAGEGMHSWMNGAAGSTWLATTAWLLGVRPTYAGLQIDPCLPSRWRRCRVVRAFRGAVYDITLLNPQRVQRGVASLTVDGQRLEGAVVPPHGDHRVHRVIVTMGPVTPVRATRRHPHHAASS